jgi:hypothetical protein
VNQWAYSQTLLARASVSQKRRRPCFALANLESEQHSSPFTRRPQRRPFAWRRKGDDAVVWFTHWLLAVGRGGRATEQVLLLVDGDGILIYRCLRLDVSVERQFFRISPAITRSLASVLVPRPAALGVLLRTACALRVWVSKEKISLRLRPLKGRDFCLRSLRRKTRLRPWERGTSRRFAHECPE